MNLPEFKIAVYQHCCDLIKTRLQEERESFMDLQESALADSRNSAGDKYETGIAMAHQELEKRQQAIDNLVNHLDILNRLDPKHVHSEITYGSLVSLGAEWIFIAASLGPIVVEGRKVLVISGIAPLAQHLMRKTAGETTSFNTREYRITEIA